MTLKLRSLLGILLSFPAAYFLISYLYLASWHQSLFLWNKVIHENGRLTLLASMFYFDHFVACVPMVVLFALCTVGGFSLANRAPVPADPARVRSTATTLLFTASLFILLAFVLSIYTVGWQRTADYALQRIERDGVMSKGGNWNQLQLSNLPIALGALALGSAVWSQRGNRSTRKRGLAAGAIAAIGLATLVCVGITAFTWSSWSSFLNLRWLAHSIREISTYPLTGIPIALAGVVLVEARLSGTSTFKIQPHLQSLIFLGVSIAIVVGQLVLIRNADVLSLAQRPSFAPNGLSIPYLLFSHVFEHFLDFALIGPLAGGIYASLGLFKGRESSAS